MESDDLQLRNRIFELAVSIIGGLYGAADLGRREQEEAILRIIISNSIQAASFVALIEDEFEIELDDEDINMSFFSDFDYIIGCLKKYDLSAV